MKVLYFNMMRLNIDVDDSLEEVVDRYDTGYGAKTEYIEQLVQMSAEFKSLDEMKEALEGEGTQTEGIVVRDSINYNQLELGHGIPFELEDENWAQVVKTNQSSRLPVLEGLVTGAGPYVCESDIEHLIDMAFNFPAEQTKKNYKKMLVAQSPNIFALPGSDPRIVQPSGDFGVEYVGMDSSTYDADDIENKNKRKTAKRHWSKNVSYVWDEIESGFVTDEDVWIADITELMTQICRVIEQITDKSEVGHWQDTSHRDGQARALKLLYDRLIKVSPYDPSECWSAYGCAKSQNRIDYRSRITNSINNSEESLSKQEAAEILGVDVYAETDIIYESYQNLVKKKHPDVGGSADEFKKVNNAKEVLI